MYHSATVRLLVSGLLAMALFVPVVAGSLAAPPRSPAIERVIVVFNDTVTDAGAAANDLSQKHNADVSFVYEHALKGFAAEIPAQAMAGIAHDPRVAYVERDQVVQAFDVPTGVDRIEGDKKTGALDDEAPNVSVNVDIAIIDTGIDHNHSDLNVVGGAKCTGGSPFSSSCSTGRPGDDNGHGTHVAGTAAAKDNGSGVVGVAPGANLYAVKVLRSDGSGYISWIVAGIDWVTERAETIEVANMSLGCECSSASLNDALTNSTKAGVVYVVAAGNSGKDAATFSPANHPQVIAVSAMADFDGKGGAATAPTCRDDVGTDDTFATFSNFGDDVDLAAPGVCILSTVPGGGYDEFSGTSMASPHAAGAAALYIDANGRSNWSTVLAGLQSAAWSVSQTDQACGFTGGKSSERFLMLATCDSASGDPPPAENSPPVASFTASCNDLTCGFDGSGSSDTEAPIASYAWTFGDKGTGTGATVSHTYAVDGTYTVTLTVTDGDGATDSESQSVTVASSSGETTMHVGDLDRSSVNSGSTWTATVTVTIHDNAENPVAGATVSGTWTINGSTFSGSCSTTTDVNGKCTMTRSGIAKRISSVTFTVTGVTHTSLTYASADNHDPDGDSDGTSITVFKP